MQLSESLKFFIEKTKDPSINWIFLKPYLKIKGKRAGKVPCSNCKYAVPQEYEFEKIYGPAVRCQKWEKPNKKNWCNFYINSKYNKENKREDGRSFDF